MERSTFSPEFRSGHYAYDVYLANGYAEFQARFRTRSKDAAVMTAIATFVPAVKPGITDHLNLAGAGRRRRLLGRRGDGRDGRLDAGSASSAEPWTPWTPWTPLCTRIFENGSYRTAVTAKNDNGNTRPACPELAQT